MTFSPSRYPTDDNHRKDYYVCKARAFLPDPKSALAVFALSLFAGSAHAATEKVLHSFNDNGKDGSTPDASLITDKGRQSLRHNVLMAVAERARTETSLFVGRCSNWSQSPAEAGRRRCCIVSTRVAKMASIPTAA